MYTAIGAYFLLCFTMGFCPNLMIKFLLYRIFVVCLLFACVLLLVAGCGQKSEIDTSPGGGDPPQVIMKSPADQTTNFLPEEPRVWALFNKDMNSTSVRTNTFLRTSCNQTVPLQQGSPAYDPQTRTVTILPTKLEANQQYVARITRSATDLEGSPLQADEIWRFTTGERIDNFAPMFDGVQTITVNSSTELTLQWSAAVDDIDQATSQDQLEYLLYRGTAAVCDQGQINFSTPLKTLKSVDVCKTLDQDSSTLECSYQMDGLSANTKYCFAVRTRDRGCHIDGNRKIIQDTTKTGGKLYVANLGLNNLLVFDNAGEAEKVSPRVIRSNQTQLNVPIGLSLAVLNPANQFPKKSLYVANFRSNSILAYDWQEGSQISTFPSGDVLPRVLGGGLSSLSQPIGLFADSSNDRLYVSNYNTNAIVVFEGASSITNVSTPPRRIVIVSSPPDVIPYDNPIGIGVDTSRDVLYVVYQGTNNIAIVDGISQVIQQGGVNIPPTRLISGLGQSTNHTRILNPRGLWLDSDNDRLYVVNQGVDNDNGADDSILVYDKVSEISGNVFPSWIIKGTGSNPPLFNRPYMISMVSYSGDNSALKHRLFVANSGDNDETGKILMFDDIDSDLDSNKCIPDSLGVPICNSFPDVVVGGPKTHLEIPRGVFAEHQDDGTDSLYISNQGSFSTFSINAFEKVVPPNPPSQVPLDRKPEVMIVPSIQGPTGVVVNTASEALYLSNILGDSISIFQDINNTNTAGNIRPSQRIFGSETGLSAPAGLALAGDKLYVANLFENNILEFDLSLCPAGDCNIRPTADSGMTNSLLRSPLGIAVDSDRNLVFVSNRDLNKLGDQQGNSIIIYQRTENGFIPVRIIKGVQTGLRGPAGLYLYPYNQHLFVANRQDNTILVFDVSDQGFNDTCSVETMAVCNQTPVQIISNVTGAISTLRLTSPNWVFLDDFSNPHKLYVTNRDNRVILVYKEAETINGAVLPERSVGASSGLNTPVGIFLDPRK